VHTLFGPSLSLPSDPSLFLQPPHFQAEPILPSFPIFWRENIKDNKKDIAFLLAWDKYSYTERFLALLPCTCALQPKLVHLYQTSSLLPSPHPLVASVSLRLLYLLLCSGDIKDFQVLGFLPFPIPPVFVLPLVCDPCPIILLHLFQV
jgi:hypothetical protein